MRTRAALAVVATLCALVAALVSPPPASADTGMEASAVRDVPVLPMYLALGDSVAFGVGADLPPQGGYVARLHNRLLRELPCWPTGWYIRIPGCLGLWRINHAVPGATTGDVLRDQVPPAVAALEARNGDASSLNDVRAVTVTVGGNDVFAPVLRACGEPAAAACAPTVVAQLEQVARNLPSILEQLVSAAGPRTAVVVMTYYNPLPSCDLSSLADLAAAVLEGGPVGAGGPVLPAGLNDVIRQSAHQAGAVVAETSGLLGAGDFVGGSDCLHPDDSGHALIADSFAEVILSR